MKNQDTHRAILWAALGKMAEKEGRRDLLEPGSAHGLALRIRGETAGAPILLSAEATLSIGHDGLRASSTAPKTAELVAYLLARMPKTRRAQVCRELPEEFLQAGGVLATDPADLAAAESLCARLRVKTQQTVRGAVSCCYELKG